MLNMQNRQYQRFASSMQRLSAAILTKQLHNEKVEDIFRAGHESIGPRILRSRRSMYTTNEDLLVLVTY